MMTGVELIAAERQRQVTKEGWSASHDDEHTRGELAAAAICYASPFVSIRSKSALTDDHVCDPWPIEWDFKPSGDRVRDLVKAGALIAAEIDRLRRLAEIRGGGGATAWPNNGDKKLCPECGGAMVFEDGDSGNDVTPPIQSGWGCDCGHTENHSPTPDAKGGGE